MLEAHITYPEKPDELTLGMCVFNTRTFYVQNDDVSRLRDVCAQHGWRLDLRPVAATSVGLIEAEVLQLALPSVKADV